MVIGGYSIQVMALAVPALVLAHIGRALSKKASSVKARHGRAALWFIITLVLILVREPEKVETGAKEDRGAGFIANLKEVLNASDRSGLLILLAILFWFIGYNAVETWLSSFGKFSLGIGEGRMAILTSGTP